MVGVPKVTVVVPVHNEEANLELCCEKILDSLGDEIEILFVNDGSTDKSIEILRRLVADVASVRALTLSRQCGQSCALVTGVRNARAPLIVSLDADLQYECNDLLPMIKLLSQGHPIVVGHRQNSQRNVLHKMAVFMARGITNAKAVDPFCPVKGLRAEVVDQVEEVDYHLSFPGLALLGLGLPVLESPIRKRPRLSGRTSYSRLRLVTRFLSLGLLYFTGWAPRPNFKFTELRS